MENFKPANPSEKSPVDKRREMIKKSAEENLENVADASQDVKNIEIALGQSAYAKSKAKEEDAGEIESRIKQLNADLEQAKNKEELNTIYARMAELVKEKKALNKKQEVAGEEKGKKESEMKLPEVKSSSDSNELIDRINKLFQSEGSGIEGRQKKIDLLREIYGDEFVKNNITETGAKGVQKDIVNNILQQSVGHIERDVIQKQKNEELGKNKDYFDRINKLFQSEGSGIEGRQKKIDLLREIYGDEFVKNNITETGAKGSQEDPVNDLLTKAAGEMEKKLQKLTSREEAGQAGKKYVSEESRRIIEELKSLKKRAKELEALEGGNKSEELHKSTMSEALKKAQEEKEEIEKGMDKVSGGETKSKEQTREDLQKALKDARDAYARQDLITYSTLQRLKRVLGAGAIAKDEQKGRDLEERKRDYEKALADWKQLRINEFKEKYQKMSPEELAANRAEMDKDMNLLLKEFKLDQKLDLYQARTDAIAKAREGKLSGMIFECGKKIINGYRKLPLKYKMLVAAGLFVGGGGLAAFGALAGVSTASLGVLGTNWLAGSTLGMGTLFGMRTLGGAASGVGAAEMKKNWRRSRQTKGAEKEIGESMENLDQLKSPEEILNSLNQNLDKELETFDSNYQTEIKKSGRDKLLGATVAVLPAAVREYLTGGEMAGKVKAFFGSLAERVGLGGTGGGKIAEGAWDKISGVETVKKGDSVWKLINHQLEERYGDQFKNLDPMKKNILIDTFKDKVVENPGQFGLKNPDLIHPNQKIDFSSLFKDKTGVDKLFNDVSVRNLDQVAGGKGSGRGAASVFEQRGARPSAGIETTAPTAEGFDFSQVDHELEGIQDIASRTEEIMARNPNINQLNYGEAQLRLARITEQMTYHKQSLDLGVEYGGGSRGSGTSIREHLKYLVGERDKLTQQIQDYNDVQELKGIYTQKYKNIFNGVSNMILRESSPGQTLEGLSSTSAAQFIGEHPGGKFNNFYRDCEKVIGANATRPLEGEDLNTWTRRMIRQIIKVRAVR